MYITGRLADQTSNSPANSNLYNHTDQMTLSQIRI